MSRTFTRMAMTLLFALVASAAVQAQAPLPDGVYRLTDEAKYWHGCFPPCECALHEAPLRGTFRMELKETGPLFYTYGVRDVNWLVDDETELYIRGSGEYRIGGEFVPMHRMELDLWVGEEPVQHFDSGWVPVQPGTADLDITVSINGMYCLDTVLRVVADWVSPREIRHYLLGPGSGYQTGCWPPCLCPLMEVKPVRGSFGLVPLRQTPLFDEYAVVDVDWAILDEAAPTPEGTPVTGAGLYRRGGEVAPMHAMTLWLSLDGAEPLRFASGWVMGGQEFPRINIDVSVNGFYCFDQAFYIRAWPVGPGSETPREPELTH